MGLGYTSGVLWSNEAPKPMMVYKVIFWIRDGDHEYLKTDLIAAADRAQAEKKAEQMLQQDFFPTYEIYETKPLVIVEKPGHRLAKVYYIEDISRLYVSGADGETYWLDMQLNKV